VISEREDVGARAEQLVGELWRDARAVGDILAVDDADVCTDLVAQRGEPLFDGASSGDAEDVCEEEDPQFKTSVAAGRSSTET
jgi:hypothetical protein